MKRSVGVTVIAVLSLIGSILVLFMGVVMLAVLAFAPPPHAGEFPVSPAVFKLILVLASMMYILPGIWGISTSIGLFRLSNWARISIMVFSVLLILMSGFSSLMSLVIPALPSDSAVNPAMMSSIRAVMGFIWLTLLGVGIWWLVFFTRVAVKQQFELAGPPPSPPTPEIFACSPSQSSVLPSIQCAPRRPVSFTVIAWFLLIGCLFVPVDLMLHFPAILMTKFLTGWSAGLYYIAMAALSLYVGIGLLRFKPLAREVGIAYFVFLLVNAGIFYFAPGGRGRMRALLDLQSTMFPWMRLWQSRPELQFDMMPAVFLGGTVGIVFLAVPIYFLITRKRAFESAAAMR